MKGYHSPEVSVADAASTAVAEAMHELGGWSEGREATGEGLRQLEIVIRWGLPNPCVRHAGGGWVGVEPTWSLKDEEEDELMGSLRC